MVVWNNIPAEIKIRETKYRQAMKFKNKLLSNSSQSISQIKYSQMNTNNHKISIKTSNKAMYMFLMEDYPV